MHDKSRVQALSNASDQIINSWKTVESGARDFRDVNIDLAFVRQYFKTRREEFEFLLQETMDATPGDRVAEIGPAFGFVLGGLKQYGLRATALEHPENIDAYTRGLCSLDIPVVPFNIYDDPATSGDVPGAPFDMLICTEVVEHLHVSLDYVLAHATALLRPGGKLLLTTPNIYRLENLRRLIKGRNLMETHPGKPVMRDGHVVDNRVHPREYTFSELLEAFSSHQWGIVRTFDWGEPNGSSWRTDLLIKFFFRTLLRFKLRNVLGVVATRPNASSHA